jgi:hypothetical protein
VSKRGRRVQNEVTSGHDIIPRLTSFSLLGNRPRAKEGMTSIADPLQLPGRVSASSAHRSHTKRATYYDIHNNPSYSHCSSHFTFPLKTPTNKSMSFTLTRRTLFNQSIRTTATNTLRLRTMSTNPAISNPAKSETENRGPQFGFKERQPEAEEKKVMDDILNLCECMSVQVGGSGFCFACLSWKKIRIR